MTAGPADEKAAGTVGRGHLRASHADRDQVIDTLKAAFVQGRLAKDEFDLRVGQTLTSRTYAELAALTADIPAGMAVTRPPRTSHQAGAGVPAKVAKTATGVGLALALLVVAAFLGRGNGPERLIALAVFFLPLCGLSIGGLLLLHSWLEKRTSGQLRQGPPSGTGVQGSQRAASAAGPAVPPQVGPASPRRADAAQRHPPRARPAMIWPLPASGS